MDGIAQVIAAAVAFVGTHFLLSHPLRSTIVSRVGATGFLGVYSLVAAVTLAWLALAYRAAPMTPMLWMAGDLLWAVASAAMLIAAVLLMGSLVGNPALPGQTGGAPAQVKGVFAITRHPMMWAFALWALVHVAVYPVAANIVVALAILILALVGAHMQDRKKAALQPHVWPDWERRTSYWPFVAIAQGRAKLGGFGMHALAGGVVVWLAATWAHLPLAGWAAGIWRWV